MSRILVADDDAGIRQVVRDALEREGHDVDLARDGSEASSRATRGRYDLVITDLAMPGKEGLALVREIRAAGATPILVLTVHQEEREKVRLLDAGADDYVTKPFGVSELLARVRALLRRALPRPEEGPVRLGRLEVDLGQRRVRRGGEEIRLSPTEFALLTTFLSKPGAVWTHRQLIAAVWGGGEGVSHDVVRVHVGSLRRKIEEDPDRPRHLLTEPWVGYRFVLED